MTGKGIEERRQVEREAATASNEQATWASPSPLLLHSNSLYRGLGISSSSRLAPMEISRETTTSGSERPGHTPSPRARSLAPFLSKTYELVEGSAARHVVSWNEEGTGFVVWRPQEFSQLILPRYFKHCNFASFIRQLNTYGFKKSASDRWEFRHEKFQKDRRHLLAEITRRKCEPSAFPSFLKASETCRPPIDNDLLEENKVLQQKNAELVSQIKQYKALKAELLKCLSQYV